MKLIRVENLKNNDIVGRSVYDENGRCLLARNFKLSEKIIKIMQSSGIKEIWIIEENEQIFECLSQRIKTAAIKSLESIYGTFSNEKINYKEETKKIQKLKEVVEYVVDELIKNKDCIIQLSYIETYDENTYEHSIDVARIATLIGINMELNRKKLLNLCLSALLHDIGKTQINIGIIQKPAKLTNEEFEEVKKHCELGYSIIKKTNSFDTEVFNGILDHHERYDGNGYPNRLVGGEISLYGRILKIADVYCAMVSQRSYKSAFSAVSVRETFCADSSEQFDPDILKLFLSKIPIYEIGQVVEISTGEEAVIIENNIGAIFRPIIQIEVEGNEKKIINLSERINFNITIVS